MSVSVVCERLSAVRRDAVLENRGDRASLLCFGKKKAFFDTLGAELHFEGSGFDWAACHPQVLEVLAGGRPSRT